MKLPKKKIKILENNIRVVSFEYDSFVPHIQVNFNSGSRFDYKDLYGLAHLTEHISLKNSPKYKTAQNRDRVLEELGCYSKPYTTRERIVFQMTYGDIKNTRNVLELLYDEVMFNEIKTLELDFEKQIVVNEISNESCDERIESDLWASLFLSEDLVHDPLGYKSNLELISKEDIKLFHTEMISSGTTILTTGGVSEDLISKVFSKLPNQIARKEINTKLGNKGKEYIKKHTRDDGTVSMCLGFITPSISNLQSQMVLRLIRSYLLSLSISPIFQKLRYDKSLIYTYDVDYSLYSDLGVFDISLEVNMDDYNEVYEVITTILLNLAKNGIPEKELLFLKKHILNSYPICFQTGEQWVNSHSLGETVSPDQYLSEIDYIKSLKKITNDDIVECLRKYVHTNSLLSYVVGDTD